MKREKGEQVVKSATHRCIKQRKWVSESEMETEDPGDQSKELATGSVMRLRQPFSRKTEVGSEIHPDRPSEDRW